jgi:hypothetical protein
MSLKEYGPVPIEDERDDESEGLPDPRYSSMIMRPRNSTFLQRSIYFLLAQLLIVVVTAFVSVSLFQRYWRASCAGDGLESHSA